MKNPIIITYPNSPPLLLIFDDSIIATTITKEALDQIKVLEAETPNSIKTKVVGKLDSIKHSTQQIEIIVNNKKIRAKLSESLSFEKILPLFGKNVAMIGYANFNPAGKVISFEILNLSIANDN